MIYWFYFFIFFFQAEDGIRDGRVTGVQTCALPICDGVVDSSDAEVERQLLGLWYGGDDGQQWSEVSASQDVGDKSFTYALPHFCEYAIAALLELAVSW